MRNSRADSRSAVLYGYEVDTVVELPGGARPTAMPGFYDADLAGIRSYLTAASADPGSAGELIGRLL